jgi:hypothetical protein
MGCVSLKTASWSTSSRWLQDTGSSQFKGKSQELLALRWDQVQMKELMENDLFENNTNVRELLVTQHTAQQ